MTITGKREKFCRQLALGKTKTDAYNEAYDTQHMNRRTVTKRASELAQVEAVAERVEKLQEEIEQELKYTARQSFNEFEHIRQAAMECGALLVALRAEELKGKLVGLYDRDKDKDAQKQEPPPVALIRIVNSKGEYVDP